jgi:hypothetical protein
MARRPPITTANTNTMRASVDRVRERLAPQLKAPGYAGVRARVQLSVNEAWARRLAMELDRHTPHHHIMTAFGETLTDIITGVIESLYSNERTPEQMAKIAHATIRTAWTQSINSLMNYDERAPLERIGAVDAVDTIAQQGERGITR